MQRPSSSAPPAIGGLNVGTVLENRTRVLRPNPADGLCPASPVWYEREPHPDEDFCLKAFAWCLRARSNWRSALCRLAGDEKKLEYVDGTDG